VSAFTFSNAPLVINEVNQLFNFKSFIGSKQIFENVALITLTTSFYLSRALLLPLNLVKYASS
jgi:hypothetical protein